MQNYIHGLYHQICLIGAISFALLLSACGGGGSGSSGGGSGNAATISYTGVTTQANVQQHNADDLSAGSVTGGSTGGSTSLVGVTSDVVSHPTKLRTTNAVTSIKRAFQRLVNATENSSVAGASVTVSETLPGTCAVNPGTVSYTITMDDVTGDFSGTSNYHSYCDDGDTLTGSGSFSGNYNLATDEFNVMNFSTSSITVATSIETFTMAGSINLTRISSNSENITINLNVQDEMGKVCRVENYNVVNTYNTPVFGTDSMRIVSGRFYHPDHGYVDVVTTNNFLLNNTSEYPYSGVLVATGSSGGKARLTANKDELTFTLEIDIDGNDIYEVGPFVYRWEDV